MFTVFGRRYDRNSWSDFFWLSGLFRLSVWTQATYRQQAVQSVTTIRDLTHNNKSYQKCSCVGARLQWPDVQLHSGLIAASVAVDRWHQRGCCCSSRCDCWQRHTPVSSLHLLSMTVLSTWAAGCYQYRYQVLVSLNVKLLGVKLLYHSNPTSDISSMLCIGGTVARASDFWSSGRGFDSLPGCNQVI